MALDWDILNEDMADITDWTDNDSGDATAASTQVTFDSRSCMKLYIPATPSAISYAWRYRTLTIPDTFTAEFTVYQADANGYGTTVYITTTSGHLYRFYLYNHSIAAQNSATNPQTQNAFLVPYAGATPPPFGNEDTTLMDTWVTYRIVVKSSRKVDVWVNNKCYLADVSHALTGTANYIYLYCYADTSTTNAVTTYFDDFKIDTTPEGQSTSSPLRIDDEQIRIQMAHNANWEYSSGGVHGFVDVAKARIWDKDAVGAAYANGITLGATTDTNHSKTRIYNGAAVQSALKLPA